MIERASNILILIWIAFISTSVVASRSIHRLERNILNSLDFQDVQIDGFYHVSSWQPHWRHVISEQMLILEGNRLLNELFFLEMKGNVSEKVGKSISSKYILYIFKLTCNIMVIRLEIF